MRDECQRVEVVLSYARRLAQGRLDIAMAELRRRREGDSAADVAGLVAQLPEILGRHVLGPGSGRLPTYLAPAEEDLAATPEAAAVDAVADPAALADLPERSDEEIHHLVDALSEVERDISYRRRALHGQIDALQAELVRRYKSGAANVESLLG